jgi:hypothetical protein
VVSPRPEGLGWWPAMESFTMERRCVDVEALCGGGCCRLGWHSGVPTVAADGEQGGGREQHGGGTVSGDRKRKASLSRVLFL